MADKKMLVDDKTLNLEVMAFPNKKKEFKSFTWADINEIKVKDDVKGALFFKKSTQKLEILTRNPETPSYFNPVVYYKHEHEEHFNEYVKYLKKLAEQKSKIFADERKSR